MLGRNPPGDGGDKVLCVSHAVLAPPKPQKNTAAEPRKHCHPLENSKGPKFLPQSILTAISQQIHTTQLFSPVCGSLGGWGSLTSGLLGTEAGERGHSHEEAFRGLGQSTDSSPEEDREGHSRLRHGHRSAGKMFHFNS